MKNMDENNLTEPSTPEDFSAMFDAFMDLDARPNDYKLVATLWSVEKNMPVSGFKMGMPWLGDQPLEITAMDQLRKIAADYRFYFDKPPKIVVVIYRHVPGKRKKSLTLAFTGVIPYRLLPEL